MDLSREIVLRWDAPEARHVPLLKEAGATVVVTPEPDAAFAAACEQAGLRALPASEVQAVAEGSWPGVSRGPTVVDPDVEIASASTAPWIDANGFRIAYLRTLQPGRIPLLGYLPEDRNGRHVPYDTLDLALIEAWAGGGNYVLAVPKPYRDALLKNDARARAAWGGLGRTARWLRAHAGLFARAPVPAITALVEDGERTLELANLMFRQNASPALARASDPPRPDPERRRVLVAVNLNPPPLAIRDRILAHASAGATVVVDGFEKPWWKASELKPVREQEDRWFYRLGAGTVVAYKETVEDPSEFAFDVIDLLTHPQRPVRIWNTRTAIATALESPRTLIAVNYGSHIDMDVQIRTHGFYAKARLLRPEAEPLPLKTAKRGETTEIFLPELRRLAVIEFG